MRLQVVSDLHLEFGDYKLPELDCEFLIIAGDLHLGNRGKDFLKQHSKISKYSQKSQNIQIVYVLGNHEFYNHDYHEVVHWWQQFKDPSINFLHNSSFSHENVRFIGSTLWTDVNHGNKIDLQNLGRGLNDFHVIEMEGRIFTPEDSVRLHSESRKYLESELKRPFQGKTVVITHHMPSYNSVTPEYQGDSLNPGFAANCDDLIEKYQPDLWIHGHTHSSLDYKIGKTHILCNPFGYPHEPNPEFDPNLFIEI
ncbi:MAG: metallophosphoesterase [Promethearchaeota archaeon]